MMRARLFVLSILLAACVDREPPLATTPAGPGFTRPGLSELLHDAFPRAGISWGSMLFGPTHIVLQNVNTGERAGWVMNYSDIQESVDISVQPTEWSIVATGDFTGDSEPDLVWQRRSTGDQVIWHMDDFRWTGEQTALPRVEPDWWIVGAGDFTGDGKPDLLWQNRREGRQVIWQMNGTQWGGQQNELYRVAPEWWIVGVADFSGDGKPDLLWQNRQEGRQVIWRMNGNTWSGEQNELARVVPEWQIVGAGDFNGDNQADILWQSPGQGRQVIWYMDHTLWNGDQKELPPIPTAWRIATTLVGLADATPPSITAVQVSPAAVDVTDADAQVTFDISARDTGMGVKELTVTLRLPDGKSAAWCNASTPVSGTSASGTFRCTATLVRGSADDVYGIEVTVQDHRGNWVVVSPAQLEAAGQPSAVKVTDRTPDTSPPAITAVVVSPRVVDVTNGPAQVTFSVSAREVGTAGLRESAVTLLRRRTGSREEQMFCTAQALTSGTPAEGTFTCTLTIPQDTPTGLHSITSVYVSDRLLHTTRISGYQELQAAGFPTSIEVTRAP